MGLFSCCISDRKQTKTEAEARHARVAEIYQQAQNNTQTPTQAPPPSYNEAVCDVFLGTTTIVEEKPRQLIPEPQSQVHQENACTARPASPRTSIYSVPSTRLTDITSMHTGATAVPTHRGDSPRSSLAFDSAPPSYYDDRSMRERSRSPDYERGPQGEQEPHPVMADNWLDRLLAAAERDGTEVRNTRR
ncbi:hypothetical protein LTS08_006874 [Lithohypha guttulata]|nr:hypothetical protein LTR51_001928 [Lithohypha guttulata]KAK5097462.1 hypothetical protein LTS08_006874 [Lithohypha guttulata]